MSTTRKLKKKHRRRNNFFKYILFIAVLSISMFLLLNSDFFYIKQITVFGNYKIEADDIIVASDISKGENIFKTSLSTSKESIEKMIYVKEAKIKRKLPNTIVIDIIEREEKLIIAYLSSYLVADDEGVILEQRSENDKNLLFISGLSSKNYKLGDNIFTGFKNNEISEFTNEIKSINLINIIKEIDMQNTENITIRLNNDIDIAFGSLDNVKYKLGLLEEVLKDAESKNIKYKQVIMNRGSHPILVVDEDEEG